MAESPPIKPHKRWLAYDPEVADGEGGMKFRLTYEGRLKGEGSPKHKHDIRRALHPQLKRLWEVHPALNSNKNADGTDRPVTESIGDYFKLGQFRFVPLAMEKQSLLVGLEILFLRTGTPGKLMKSGDIDNRLKTLFDAIKMPRFEGEIGATAPEPGENPMFVLLQDDSLVSHVSVETDVLLEPTPSAEGAFLDNDSRLVITVTVRPYELTWHNMGFSG
jgi:hypothetical protein